MTKPMGRFIGMSDGCLSGIRTKPGDLMYYDYTGENQNQYGAHLAIVLRVEDVDGNGEIEPGEVWLIESTFILQQLRVKDLRMLYHSESLATEDIES
jgi:hypothetical protein